MMRALLVALAALAIAGTAGAQTVAIDSARAIVATGGTAPRTLADRWADLVNLRDYGAQVNGHRVTDAAMTSGSPIVTSASGKFAAVQAGQKMCVANAGASASTPYCALISSYQSPTQVTLAGIGAGATVAATVAMWGSDDAAAWSAAITRENALVASGRNACIYAPAGYSVISTAAAIPAFVGPGCITGQGRENSKGFLLPDYAGGDLFVWDDVWQGNFSQGPRVQGFEVVGVQETNGLRQNAFRLYDHIDHAYFFDFGCEYLHGQCLQAGAMKNDTNSTVRESHFILAHLWGSGIWGTPTANIELRTDCASGCGPGVVDGANNNYIIRPACFAPYDQCILFHNNSQIITGTGSPMRYNYIVDGRFEGGQHDSATADLVTFGSTTDTGEMEANFILAAQFINPHATGYGFRQLGNATCGVVCAPQVTTMTDVSFDVGVDNDGAGAVRIDAANGFNLVGRSLATFSTGLTIGAAPMVAGDLKLDVPIGTTESIDASAVSLTRNAMYMLGGVGNPLNVAQLPACTGNNQGLEAPVQDATSNTFHAALAGGGSQRVKAYCAGSVSGWVVGG